MESIKKIYGPDLWERDPFFKKGQGGEFTEGNLAAVPMKEGLKMRRLMSAPFGRKYLLDQQFVFKGCVDKTMDEIVRLGGENGGVVDLYDVTRMFSFAVVGRIPRWFGNADGRRCCCWRVLQTGRRDSDA